MSERKKRLECLCFFSLFFVLCVCVCVRVWVCVCACMGVRVHAMCHFKLQGGGIVSSQPLESEAWQHNHNQRKGMMGSEAHDPHAFAATFVCVCVCVCVCVYVCTQ